MNLAATLTLSLAMSTDAFAFAVGKGASFDRPSMRQVGSIGLVFGVVGAVTMVIGRVLGQVAASYLDQWGCWIAFAVLAALGGKMIHSSRSRVQCELPIVADQSMWLLTFTAFGTSFDGMAVGASLAFVDANVYTTAVTVGFATCLMVCVGIMVGRAAGSVVGKRAECLGGVVLILIGGGNLLKHFVK